MANKLQQLLDSHNSLKKIIYEKLRVDNQNKENNKEINVKTNKIDNLERFIKTEINRLGQLIKSNKNNKANTKERQVVEKTKSVYLESFSDKAIFELNNLFQKIFNIKIIQPKEESVKRSNIWLVALAGLIGLIIANFSEIQKYISSIDWNKIWSDTKGTILNFLAELPFQIINNLDSIFKNMGDIIKAIFNSDEFKKFSEDIKKTIIPTEFINNIINELTTFFTKNIPNMFTKIVDNIKQYIYDIFNSVNDLLGFKFIDTGEDNKDKTDAVKADEKIQQMNEQDKTTIPDLPSTPDNNMSQATDNVKNLEPSIAVANNMKNFNQLNGGNITKSLVTNNGQNITMTPLDNKDTAVILKENGIIDKRLNEILSVINKQTTDYIAKFDTINNEILEQNNILSQFNENNKKDLIQTLNTNNNNTALYVNSNIKEIYNTINEIKQPSIERSSIDAIRLQYING